jgi:acetyl esterase/lipase
VSRDVLSRPAPGPDFTLTYGELADHVADVWLPPSALTALPSSLVVFLHGGFWRHDYDRTHLRPLAVALAAVGHVVALPEYRRTGAPGGGWPGTFDDVAAAVRLVPSMIGERLGATLSLILGGHSAGGQLALWAGAGLVRTGSPPSGVVALAPVADLRTAYELDLDRGAVAALLGGGPDTVPERYAAADPLALVPVGAPVTVVHGDRDAQVPLAQSRAFAAVAAAVGDRINLEVLLGADHFDVIDPLSPMWHHIVTALGGYAR